MNDKTKDETNLTFTMDEDQPAMDVNEAISGMNIRAGETVTITEEFVVTLEHLAISHANSREWSIAMLNSIAGMDKDDKPVIRFFLPVDKEGDIIKQDVTFDELAEAKYEAYDFFWTLKDSSPHLWSHDHEPDDVDVDMIAAYGLTIQFAPASIVPKIDRITTIVYDSYTGEEMTGYMSPLHHHILTGTLGGRLERAAEHDIVWNKAKYEAMVEKSKNSTLDDEVADELERSAAVHNSASVQGSDEAIHSDSTVQESCTSSSSD